MPPDDQRMLDRFVRLCEIASPTGEEREVADAVLDELRELGVDVAEDASATPARAAAGNLIARVPGTGEGWLSFFSHLDTVPHQGPIEVVRENGAFRTRGDTILGADNKAAVTVLIELAARHLIEPGPLGLELVFTVAEEDGLRGAKELDISSLRAPFGFVLDHATPIGELIVAAPTYKRLIAEFTGHEAHAGINPEDGHSAIAAAAAAVAGMKLGRLDEETTANVGTIAGGVARNVVPPSCRVEAEVRSRDMGRLAEETAYLLEVAATAAADEGCTLETAVREEYAAYRFRRGDLVVRLARQALEAAGIPAREEEVGGGADAHIFNERGIPCVVLTSGMERIHGPGERILAADVDRMSEITVQLIAAARAS